MASTEPSRRASIASSSEMSLVDPVAGKKLPPKKDKVTGGVKLKKSIAKKTKPKDTESNGTKTAGPTRSPSPDSPAVNGSAPKAGDNPDLIRCNHCKKPMPESIAASHAPLCLEKKRERARKKKEAKEAKARDAKAKEAAGEKVDKDKDKDGDSVMGDSFTASRGAGDENSNGNGEGGTDSTKKPPKKSASKNASTDPKKSKKRKADAEADKEPKKKKLKKDEPPKPKVAKPKGPVSVESQCGVLLPNGGMCARSLTCKSHSMGAKRSVPGRSLPYDQLLAQYQKRNQAKIQKAALSAAAPLPDDEPPTGPVDSDEEKEAVMAAIARSRPRPLEQHVFVPTARKYRHVRMKEMLGNALGVRGGGGGGLFGGAGAGGRESVLGEGVVQAPVVGGSAEGAGGEAGSRKGSLAQQGQGRAASGGGTAAAPIRKASVASAGGG
ncbi:hypothetical protein MMC28_003360 [Mycoblastus sanguinarius]|nr:hypothetical protein [Mycoblastus sanguinarius]